MLVGTRCSYFETFLRIPFTAGFFAAGLLTCFDVAVSPLSPDDLGFSLAGFGGLLSWQKLTWFRCEDIGRGWFCARQEGTSFCCCDGAVVTAGEVAPDADCRARITLDVVSVDGVDVLFHAS